MLSLPLLCLLLFLSSLIPSFLSPLSSLSPSLPELLSPYRKHRDTTFFSDTNDSVDSVDVGKQAQVVLQIRLRGPLFDPDAKHFTPTRSLRRLDRTSFSPRPTSKCVCVSQGLPLPARSSEGAGRRPAGRLRPAGERLPPPPSCALVAPSCRGTAPLPAAGGLTGRRPPPLPGQCPFALGGEGEYAPSIFPPAAMAERQRVLGELSNLLPRLLGAAPCARQRACTRAWLDTVSPL